MTEPFPPPSQPDGPMDPSRAGAQPPPPPYQPPTGAPGNPMGSGGMPPPPPQQPTGAAGGYVGSGGMPPPQTPPPSGPFGRPPGSHPGGQDIQAGVAGFFSALFDFSFSRFVTPMIVRLLYLLLTVFIVIGYIVFVVGAFMGSAAWGVLVLLIIGPIGAIVMLAFYRVTLELYLSVVRMSEDIHRMKSGDLR